MSDARTGKDDAGDAEPIVSEMVQVLNRLAARANNTPPNLDHAIIDPESNARGRWAVAAAALLVAVGMGVLLFRATRNDSDPAPAASNPDSSQSGLHGPIVVTNWTSPFDYEAVLIPEAQGVLERHEGCIRIRSRFNDALSIIVWPQRTRWDEETSSVVLTNGKAITTDEQLVVYGPRLSLEQIRGLAPDLGAVIAECVPEGSADSDVFVFLYDMPPDTSTVATVSPSSVAGSRLPPTSGQPPTTASS